MAYIGKQPKKLGAGDDLPSQAGQSGKFLKSDGTNYSWAESDGSPSIDDNGNATAITIDSSENVSIPSGNLDVTGTVTADGLTSSGTIEIADGQAIRSSGQLVLRRSSNAVRLGTGTAADYLQFYAGAAERLRITSSGNVGIGCIPTEQLHIEASSDPVEIRLRQTSNTNGFFFKNYNGGECQFVNADNAAMVFKTNDTERLRIASDGNVRIGVDVGDAFNSDSRLQIGNSGDRAFLQFKTDTSNDSGILFGTEADDVRHQIIHDVSDDALFFKSNSLEALRIDSSSRVTMPSQPAFSAKSSASGNTAASGVQIFATVETNIGGHFSSSTGKFTAPVSGMYHFSGTVLSRGSGHIRLDFQKNGSTIRQTENTRAYSGYATVTSTLSVYLSANDYVNVHSGYTTYGAGYNYFSGHLIG